MKSGYNIFWTDNALQELENTIRYIAENWTEKELIKLSVHIEKTIHSISQNPYLFQTLENNKNIRRVAILSFNTLYYRISENDIEILSFFSNRQSPEKRKLE